MFHDTMTFRADYGTNLAIEGANAERAYMRAFHDAPNPRRQVAAAAPVTECTRVADDWGELNDDIFIGCI